MRKREVQRALRKNNHFPIIVLTSKYEVPQIGTNPRIEGDYILLDQMPLNTGTLITGIKSVSFLSIRDACSLLERLLRAKDDVASAASRRFGETIEVFFKDKLRYEQYYGYNKKDRPST